MTTTEPSLDDSTAVFEALADGRRRFVVRYVNDRSRDVGIDSLAVALHVAERTGGDDSEAASAEEVHLALHHVHLPRLSDVGLLDYDVASRRVAPVDLGDRRRVIDRLLDSFEALSAEFRDSCAETGSGRSGART